MPDEKYYAHIRMRCCSSQAISDHFFLFQAEDGIRGGHVTGVQTCALPISARCEWGRLISCTLAPRSVYTLTAASTAAAVSGCKPGPKYSFGKPIFKPRNGWLSCAV